jgi:hypothetical protein
VCTPPALLLCRCASPISGAAGAYIGIPDIGPDIDTDIRYVVYDIGDMMTRYRVTPDIGTNIGVNHDMTRYWGSFDMSLADIISTLLYM